MITRDVIKYLSVYSEQCVRIATEMLREKAAEAMKRFYDDYDPIYYNRTYDLKDNSYKTFYKKNGNRYRGGVIVCPDNMSPYASSYGTGAKEVDPMEILQLGWHGFHGHPSNGVSRMSPNPLDIMNEIYDGKKTEWFMSTVQSKAKDIAQRQSYECISFK